MAKKKKTQKQPTYSSITDIANRQIKKNQGTETKTANTAPKAMYNTRTSGSSITSVANKLISDREERETMRKNYQKQQEQKKSAARTQAWKNLTQQTKYGADGQDRSYQAYAAKMMADTPGAIQREQQKELDRSRSETEKMKTLTQDLTYGYGGRYDPSLAYQAKMSGLKADQARKIVDDDEKLYQAFQRAQKEYKALEGTGYKGIQNDRQVNKTGNNLTIDQFNRVYRQNRQNQAQGLMDNGTDPMWMSAEGLKNYRANAEEQAKQRRARAEQIKNYDQDSALAGLFEYVYNRDLQNEQAILDNPVYRGTDYEANALLRKNELESGYNAQRRMVTEAAQRLLDSGMNLQGATEEEKKAIRQQVYDWIMPDSYKERTKTRRDKEEIDGAIDSFIEGLTNPWGEGTQADAITAAEREAEAYESAVKAADREQSQRETIERWRARAADDTFYNQPGTYVEANAPQVSMVFDDTADDFVPQVQGDRVDQAYWYANNYMNMGGLENSLDYSNKYMFIASDPEILETFNEMYNKDKANGYRGERGSNLAEQFLEAIDPYLTSMMTQYQNDFIRSRAEDPVAGTALRIMSPALNTIGGITGTLGALTGADADSKMYLTSRIVSEGRSQQNENVGEWADRVFGKGSGEVAQFLMGVVDSMADNVFAMNTGTALAGDGTKAAMRTVQLIMSGEATSHKMIENLDKGMGNTEAALYAIGDGVIEWLTEKYSLEQIMGPDVRQLFGNKRAMASFIARSAVAEGSEEIASDLLNMGLDSILSMIYGHEDELKAKYNDLVANQGMSHEEASRTVLEEKLREIGLSGLAGGLSGLGMAGSRAVSARMDTGRTGQRITQESTGMDTMLKLAQNMTEGSESRTLAEQLAAEKEAGKKVSDYDLGRLARLTAMDIGEERSAAIRDTVDRTVLEQLKARGVTGEQATDIAQVITRNIMEGGKMSQKERQVLASDERAIDLYDSYNTISMDRIELEENVKEATAEKDSILDQIGELTGEERTAKGAAAGEIEQSISETGSMEEAIDNMQARRSDLLSEGYANLAKEMLKNSEATKLSKNYLDDVMKIRFAAMTEGKMPRTGLKAEVAQKLFDAAQAEFNEEDANRVRPQAKAVPGEGWARFGGKEYGTKEFAAAVSGLTKQIRNQIGALGEIAARTGMKLNLVNDQDNENVYGFEDAETGEITINVANGMKHHMLVTMGHEMTHWLEQNSRGGYNTLRSFVLDSLRKQGVDVEDRLVKIMDNYNMVMGENAGNGLTINGAMAELVAQGCENILSSPKMAEALNQQNPTVYNKIKTFVKDFVARINEAIKGMTGSLSYEARTLAQYRDEITDIWLKARDEAQGTDQALAQEAEEQTEVQNEENKEAVQYSLAQLDSDYQTAVNEGNEEEQQRIIEQAAAQAGYSTKKLYHGTKGAFGFTEFSMMRGEGFIFATSDRKVAESYSGETEKSRITDATKQNAENLHKNKLLTEAKKYIRRYEEYKWLNPEARAEAINETKTGLSYVIEDMKNDVENNKYAYDEEKKAIADRMISALQEMHDATDRASLNEAWDKFESASWDMKWMDEDRLEELMGTGRSNRLYREKNALSDYFYDGDVYVSKYTNNERVLDQQLAIEVNSYLHRGVYELYGNNDKQLVIDAKGSNWNQIVPPEELNLYGPQRTRDIAEAAEAKGYTSILIRNLKDNGGETAYNWPSDVYIYTDASQVKSADPVTYDDSGKPIPPSQRFNVQNRDIRYSVEQKEINNRKGETMAEELTGGSYSMYSLKSWQDEDINDLVNQLIQRGFEEKDVTKWVKDVNSIAAMIASDRNRWDYEAAPNSRMLKNNAEYIKTLDASTLCAKRLLYQGIFNEIQHMLPNTPLMPEDLINLVNMMKEDGKVTPCAICYVESRRRMLGKYAQQWLKDYEGAYKPKLEEVTTTDGLDSLRAAPEGTAKHQAYEDFVAAMNAKGSANPKVVQLRTDYKAGEIRNMTDSQIQKVKEIGGLRIQSFSDFETVHMIDMMQAVMDMAAKGLTSQAYTKVPAFAWIFGDTGIKINLSLIGEGTGLDENGNLVFSDTEGMPFDEAMKIRKRYSANVGTILVGMNDDHIIAAMGDDRIDFIIPFHKSGWSKRELARVHGMSTYKDYTRWQNEKLIDVNTITEKGFKTIPNKKSKISNFTPVGPQDGIGKGYWSFDENKNGEWNARNYLKLCKDNNRVPKFANFLVYDGEGGYTLPTGNDARSKAIRKGYWKLLIDFKMYDNNGKPSPQKEVTANFNMKEARRVMNEYEGGANQLPTDHKIAQEFVDNYKKNNPRTQYSIAQSPDMEVENFMMGLKEFNLGTVQEKTMYRQFVEHKRTMELLKHKISERERMRDELMAKGRLDPAKQAEVDRLNTQIREAKAETEAKQKELIEANNKLTQEKWAIQKEGRLTTEERARLKEINATISANSDRINGMSYDLSKKIREAEAQKKDLRKDARLTPYDQKRLSQISQWLDNDRRRLDRSEQELIRVTNDKGYAHLMMKQESMMKNLVSGRTAAELTDTVDAITRKMDDVDHEVKERSEKLKGLAQAEAVLRVRQQFNRAGLKNIAAELKAELKSELSNKEIENRLALIALKMKQGEMDTDTTAELADLLAGRMQSDYDSYIISELRGSTIALGKVQLDELKGQGRTLKDIQQELSGTGIRVSDKGSYTLDEKWNELCDLIPTLDRDASPGDMLDGLMDVIRSEKQQTSPIYSDEDMMKVSASILTAAQKLIPEIVTDAKSLDMIRETLKFASAVSTAAKEQAQAMEDISSLISRMKKEGETVKTEAGKLTGDISEAIEYFNILGEQSEAAMWKRDRLALIDQLKSENTKALMKEAEKWRERIEKDKTARETMNENMAIRKKITTNVSRLRKLLINETDLKNVPEHMKGLARQVLGRIVNNDLTGRKLTGIAKQDLLETRRVLTAMKELDDEFTIDDLKLINDEEAQAMVADALADLEDGISAYNAKMTGDMQTNLNTFRDTLNRISDAVSTITSVINAERSISFMDRQILVADMAEDIRRDMKNSRFKGDLIGRGSKAISTARRAVVYGNTTPEYFIDNLHNNGMTMMWDGARQGENRNGLETQKAKTRLANLAEETNYKEWADEEKEVLLGGKKRKVSIQNLMELYAVWKREHTSNPEMSNHLAEGGIFIDSADTGSGKLRRDTTEQRAFRVTDEEVEKIYNDMTESQKKWIEGIVSYLSNDMSNLGNEASMRMYGIKKYKEKYYFPMKVWDGVKAARSDKGISGVDENRMAHKSWSKRRMHMAKNALVIGSFTEDAVRHIVEMINYNTMAPAIENINKVLNYKFTEDAGTESETKRNMRILFQQNYGKDALNYLETLLQDMNGGVTQDQRTTLRDKTLSMFKKNAVAGSMSVALQQPLSYIRAAMMINPKYLAEGLTKFWKGSYKEMMEHSGVAVIKKMGRFDMNFGASAKEYITPETKKSAYNTISDALTKAPEMMDTMTWTRMWSAVKAEQAAKHPGMDTGSDAFMKLVTDRFNELMRKTQVYDSVLVKSANMRSKKWELKLLTSFMAEPTLTLNVLSDAVLNAKEKGGKAKLAKAGTTFLLSAIMQAAVKGLMGSGRTPDKKKTWLENFLNKWQYNFMNEVNPFGLVPGFNDIIEVLKTGELKDDAMGAIGKLTSIMDTLKKAVEGKDNGTWRTIEDTAGQFWQLFTNIPAKNLMRDMRAMYNWVMGTEYASRETSRDVLKHQAVANLVTGDGLVGTLNTWLGEAGFVTTNGAYYGRIYEAMKTGNKAEADSLKNYMSLGKGVKDETIEAGIKNAAKKDKSLTEAEKDSWLIENNMMGENNTSTITTQYKEGKISEAEAKKLWKQLDPKLTDDDIWWKVDRIKWQQESGAADVSGYSYRLKEAIRNNKADEIKKVTGDMLKHGRTQKQIKDALSDWKSEYLAADSQGKVKIKDAITKAYKAIGLKAEDADKLIAGWLKEKKKKN